MLESGEIKVNDEVKIGALLEGKVLHIFKNDYNEITGIIADLKGRLLDVSISYKGD